MSDTTPSTSRTEVAIVGAGALGQALARRLVQKGYTVGAVLSRRRASAATLADAVDARVGSDDVADLPFGLQVVFLCVPDDTIPSVARSLAALPRDWGAVVVAHTSGTLTTEALAPLAETGATPLSFHPVQTFTAASPPSAFEGIYIGLESPSEEALTFGAQLAEDLGAHSVPVPTAAKTRYHAAAALASNGLVALMGLVSEVLASTGIDPEESHALVGPLVERTWANLATTSPEEALTGPVVRGDVGTIRAHTEALIAHQSHLLPAYAALTNEMVRLAVRSGRLKPEQAEPLLDVLHEALHAVDAPPG